MKNYVTINPCKMCQPMGAIMAINGIKDSMSLLHGSQGCATYMRLHLAHHFEEPFDVASSAMNEKAAIYGGREQLLTAIENVIKGYSPSLLAIITTCLTETIGDNVEAIVKEYKQKNHVDTEIITISTPSYGGGHIYGYEKAVYELIKHFTSGVIKNREDEFINIFIGEGFSPADVRNLKKILQSLKIEAVIIPDISESFDKPFGICKCNNGTNISDIKRTPHAKRSIVFGKGGLKAAEYLYDKFGVTFISLPYPIGIKNTDMLYNILMDMTGSVLYIKERSRLVDAMVDCHKYLSGKKTVIYGEPDLVSGILSFCLELGMKPVLVAMGDATSEFVEEVRDVLKGYDNQCLMLFGNDFDEMERKIEKLKPDIMIGNSNGRRISEKLNIPLVRVGFPIHDRVGGSRIIHICYDGALNLLDRITNTIIESRDRLFANDHKGYYNYIKERYDICKQIDVK